tara:strand:+ start:734 stop:1081 length:348 start_codon:yes stop_codon:yes gene_type:complete
MPLITTINGVPLFTSIQEALGWAGRNGLSGYHTHNYKGRSGYMGGIDHSQATGTPSNLNVPPRPTPPPQRRQPPPQPQRQQVQPQPTPPPQASPPQASPPPPQYNPGGGGGGGGY